ncbi:retrovirus-related pol polyprotein from transposon TNT 1-94, partial [Tanacetum coccineum]
YEVKVVSGYRQSTSKTYQQSLADAGSETRPPMLERGSYIPWASRFRRYINRKRENRKWLNKALDEGPYQFQMFVPSDSTVPKLQTAEDLQGDALLHYDAEIEVMNLILLSIPNDIYNSVDACTSAKDMWKRVERLMRGTIQNQVDRETRFTNEFDQFVAEPGEALVSVYNRFAQLMNDLERNNMHFPIVTINTKFLNSLQPEWLKYVTQVRLAKRLTVDTFDDLFDYLQQFEKLVNASRAKKLEKSHDPLALVAHTGSSSRNTSSYYVTHPTSVVDYDDEYQQDDVQTNSEDPLASAMLLLARAITQNFSNPTNNRLRTSSNTRNQAIIQGDRVNIQSRNSGNTGRNTRRAYVQEEVVEGSNAQNETRNVQRTLRTSSSGNTSTVQCYNCSGKGHYARNCPKPRVRDSKYFMEHCCGAKTDEAGRILTLKQIQPANNTSDAGPSYDSAFISEVQSSSINENKEQMYPTHTKIINSTIGDDQIDSNIIFDEPNGNVNSGSVEKDTHFQNPLNVRDTEDTLDDASKSQQKMKEKMNDPIAVANKQNCWTIDYKQINALYKDFVPQKELSAEQKYFPSSFIPSDKTPNATSSIPASMPKSELYEIKKQNDFFKDQLLEASLNHECEDNSLHAEIEQVKKNSIEIQEGLQAKIKILEKDVQRCQKQSVDFELKLQHEKEKHKWESTLKNKNTNPLDYSWISKIEKLENENVSLDFKVQSLIKERDNVKLEYQKLFDSIKKTRSQTQKEIDELITHVSEKTYAYGAIRAENQNLLSLPDKQRGANSNKNVIAPGMYKVVTTQESQTNEAKSGLSYTGMNVASSVRRPMNKDSHVKNSVLANSKNSAKKVAVYVRKNKQTDDTSANVISNNRNVLMLIAFTTNSRTPKSSDTTYVVLKTRFSEKLAQSKSLDTTSVVSKPKIDVGSISKVKHKVVQIVLWIVDSGCSKHMTGDRSLLRNFIEKFMGTVRFGNDNFAAITGYGDYIQGNITICHVYYVEGLGHNLFSVGQFCDGDLEVAFRSKTCYVRNLEGDDLLTGGRESNLYTISIFDMAASSPVCLMSKATSTKSWLWHCRLSHLNFGTINDLTKIDLVDGLPKFKYGKDHLCIMQQFSTARTPQQNGVVERRNRNLVKASRTMLIFSRLPKFLWAEASNVEYFHVFGSLCYPTNDRDDLGKMIPKADIGVFIGYSETSTGFQIYNRRTKKIIETIHVKFDELIAMASEHDCLEPVLQRFNNNNSLAETMNTPSKEDLDNLFGPMFEEYFEKRMAGLNLSNHKLLMNLSSMDHTSAMVKAQRGVGFALDPLTELAQHVTSKNDMLAILRCPQCDPTAQERDQ